MCKGGGPLSKQPLLNWCMVEAPAPWSPFIRPPSSSSPVGAPLQELRGVALPHLPRQLHQAIPHQQDPCRQTKSVAHGHAQRRQVSDLVTEGVGKAQEGRRGVEGRMSACTGRHGWRWAVGWMVRGTCVCDGYQLDKAWEHTHAAPIPPAVPCLDTTITCCCRCCSPSFADPLSALSQQLLLHPSQPAAPPLPLLPSPPRTPPTWKLFCTNTMTHSPTAPAPPARPYSRPFSFREVMQRAPTVKSPASAYTWKKGSSSQVRTCGPGEGGGVMLGGVKRVGTQVHAACGCRVARLGCRGGHTRMLQVATCARCSKNLNRCGRCQLYSPSTPALAPGVLCVRCCRTRSCCCGKQLHTLRPCCSHTSPHPRPPPPTCVDQ